MTGTTPDARAGSALSREPDGEPAPLAALRRAITVRDDHRDQDERVVLASVIKCRAHGLSWPEIAEVFGVSRQAIIKKYGAMMQTEIDDAAATMTARYAHPETDPEAPAAEPVILHIDEGTAIFRAPTKDLPHHD